MVSGPPPPPPPPDYSYAPVPSRISRVMSDPDATIEVVVLGSTEGDGPQFAGSQITRVVALNEIARDWVAAVLTSAVTYGHLTGMCTSPGIGFRLRSARGSVDVWVDPPEGRVQLLGVKPEDFSLSMTGIRIFSQLQREFESGGGCS